MRLFIAINLCEEMKDCLTTAIEELKKRAAQGNFTRRENLHLTLAFLGAVGSERAGAIKSAMNRVHEEPFRLSLTGSGRFRRNGGDIYWAGVEKSRELLSVHRQISVELEHAGFAPEKREYSPHLTLGREVRLLDPSKDIHESLPVSGQEMQVSKISLMKSERINGKLAYSEIYSRELKGLKK